MGYGFVQYHKTEAAQKALRQLQVHVHLYSFIKMFFYIILPGSGLIRALVSTLLP